MTALLRDYQISAVDFLLPRRRGFVVAPAGAGKTLIVASAIARVAQPGWRVGVLVNTREQLQQMLDAFGRVDGPEGVEIDVQCAAALPDFSRCHLVAVDEAHHSVAPSWLRTIVQAGGILWGVSATPFGDDEDRNTALRELFQEFHSIDRQRLLDSGHLAAGKVYVHDLDEDGQFDADIEREVNVEIIRRCRR
jgi:superfamily II DNA or RNA helicase